ncbi:hypothetical protein [Caldalkalibacillus mannanilyticus]|nr:hypothetical protein [Caldalkalibacillus mannanilyticus]
MQPNNEDNKELRNLAKWLKVLAITSVVGLSVFVFFIIIGILQFVLQS